MSADHAPAKKDIPWGWLWFGLAAAIAVGVAYRYLTGEVSAGSREAFASRFAINWSLSTIGYIILIAIVLGWIAKAAFGKKAPPHP